MDAHTTQERTLLNGQAPAQLTSSTQLVADKDLAQAQVPDAVRELVTKVQAAIDELLAATELANCSIRKFRRQIASHLGLGKKGLEEKAELVNAMIQESVKKFAKQQETPAQRIAEIIEGAGKESKGAKQYVYLVTFSHLLPTTLAAGDFKDIANIGRDEIAECVRKAFDDPLPAASGQPGRKRQRTDGLVKKLVVFKESHADGTVHFHVAVLLWMPRTWCSAKETLRVRDGLACHFSCSHIQFWSTVRYGFYASLKKPEVDASPFLWSSDGSWPLGLVKEGTPGWSFLFEACNRPWNAAIWKARSEKAQKQAAEGRPDNSCGRNARFTKLDFMAIVLDKHLMTRAAIIAYTQDHGSEFMQRWVSQNQKKLKELLADAVEWGEAREAAKEERKSDWEILCAKAGEACAHCDACKYKEVAATFFEKNSKTMSRTRFAAALRNIILAGPAKTRMTPMLTGPSNTGKSTMLNPFDQLFGKKRVFHKPALKSKYALRNILNDKRFLYWDDFRPVHYAQETVEVSTLLSLFNGFPLEVNVSQSFNDGNVDFEWRHGAAVTAPQEGLWDAWGEVTPEDVRHMRNRFEQFVCHAVIKSLKDSDACAVHMCQWIVDGAAEADAREVLQAVVPSAPGFARGSEHEEQQELLGLSALVETVKIPVATATALKDEILALGAVHVQELAGEEWRALNSWAMLKPLEQRRLLTHVTA